MPRLSLLLFLALLLVSTFFALNSVEDLPENVATHFNANGVADAWTNRDHYRLFILVVVGRLAIATCFGDGRTSPIYQWKGANPQL